MNAPSATSSVESRSLQWRYLANRQPLDEQPKNLDALWHKATGLFYKYRRHTSYYLALAEKVIAQDASVSALTEAKLRGEIDDLRNIFHCGRQTQEQTIRAAALIREASSRIRGQKHYPVQITAALALLDGYIAEMATGEGKSLMATIPAILFGWRGQGCHVMTVNDYLAARDAEEMQKLYAFCGLSCASVTGELKPDARRSAYQADITYSTNKETCADFLRDRLALGHNPGLAPSLLRQIAGNRQPSQIVMRGLHYAIIDEADSVLIDEAVTPLIISGDGNNPVQKEVFEKAAEIAREMEIDRDFKLNLQYREIVLTPAGEDRIDELCKNLGGVWHGQRRRREFIQQALTARTLFLKDKHYVVIPHGEKQEIKVVIVDEFTGRLMPDRTWRDGLHQAIEAKERITVNPPKDTFARLSFQRFFRHYHHLCGMTGTAAEASGEFWNIYRAPTLKIPTHRPCIRRQLPEKIFLTDEEKWQAVLTTIQQLHATGRPVLIGTRSVGQSQIISGMLKDINLPHQVLNAVYHAQEAQIVAQAGQPGQITVATNMAGRGTDIKLGRGVSELGGLHVIAVERNELKRVDRQLFGRAGRQGDPGSAEVFTSLKDEILNRYIPRIFVRIARLTVSNRMPFAPRIVRMLCSVAQFRAKSMAQRQRADVARSDEWLDQSLSFSGPSAG